MPKAAVKPRPNDLYERDFFAWTQAQAQLLRARRLDDLDLDNLAEEVESVGRSYKQQIENRLLVLMCHLLKWKYQPGLRGASWRRTIREQRRRIKKLVADSPSLQGFPEQALLGEYLGATLEAERETGIAVDVFPEACPFTIVQVLDDDFLPEEPGHIGAGSPTP